MKHLPDISVLINAPFDATCKEYATSEGLTPLQLYISRHGKVSMGVVKTLIELGVDIDKVFPLGLRVYNKSVRNIVLDISNLIRY